MFVLLKAIPHVKYWWETFCVKNETKGSKLFVVAPIWGSFRDTINTTLLEVMTTYIQDGPHCDRKGTKQ